MFTRPGLCGTAIGRLGLVAAMRNAFSPLSLFAAGEQGVWYDPSDLSTLFQDSAGTTPVTAVEQPVGRMLDKSGRGNHAFQTTAIDRPILRQDAGGRYYLAANGVNTRMQTNSIDFTATDKVTVFAGVRKLSSSPGMIAELSNNCNTTDGTFYVVPGSTLAGDGPYYCFGSRGSIFQPTDSPGVFAAPITNVFTGIGDIAGDKSLLRIDGAQVAQNLGNQGTGNYGNYPIYLFRRGGTSLPFNGNFYGLLIRGALCTEAQITSMEQWLAPKTGVTM